MAPEQEAAKQYSALSLNEVSALSCFVHGMKGNDSGVQTTYVLLNQRCYVCFAFSEIRVPAVELAEGLAPEQEAAKQYSALSLNEVCAFLCGGGEGAFC